MVVLVAMSVHLRSTHNYSLWEVVHPAVTDAALDEFFADPMDTDILRARVFDSDAYSFDAVQRAVQITCKARQRDFVQNDWHSLSKFVEEYVKSITVRRPRADVTVAESGMFSS